MVHVSPTTNNLPSWKISKKNDKSRNFLTVLKQIKNNVLFMLKYIYILKYWSYEIISTCKRISSIFNIFPVFSDLFGYKIWNVWHIKKSENLEILKKFWKCLKNRKCEIRKQFQKISENFKFWKISKILKKHLKLWKS